jgi:deazaflavin-dependent oxidoreductase (nitroreductase family)
LRTTPDGLTISAAHSRAWRVQIDYVDAVFYVATRPQEHHVAGPDRVLSHAQPGQAVARSHVAADRIVFPWRNPRVVPLVLLWSGAITARRFMRGRMPRAEVASRTCDRAQPLPAIERIKTRIEHEVDTRSVRLAAMLLRLTKGRIVRLWRRQALLLTTRGRKSGQERTVPLQFFADGADMIVVAANSGLPSPPGWYFNLTANPVARVEVGDRTLQVRAEELSREQAAAFWPRVLQIAPDYARYPRRTSRRLPLVRLVPTGQEEARRDDRSGSA